jgi:hypothetical protein
VCVPGDQGNPNLALLADPTDTSIVYIGGTAQPVANNDPSLSQLGSKSYSGRLFRGSRATNSWAALTHTGTASLSAPHADSRYLAWDYATGNLVHTNDGGVYIRTNPKTSSGDWFAMNGNLAVGELLSASYHSPTPAIVTGAQDNGAFYSLAKSGSAFTGRVFIGGDGGYTGIDASGSTPKFFFTAQYLSGWSYITPATAKSCTNWYTICGIAAAGQPNLRGTVIDNSGTVRPMQVERCSHIRCLVSVCWFACVCPALHTRFTL